MPYEINWETNGVVVRFLEAFNLKENNNATVELLNSPQFEDLKYIIWDLSDVSEQNMTEEEAALASIQDKLISTRLPQVKMALLAQNEHTSRVCNQYLASCSIGLRGWDFMISGSMEDIRNWVAS